MRLDEHGEDYEGNESTQGRGLMNVIGFFSLSSDRGRSAARLVMQAHYSIELRSC